MMMISSSNAIATMRNNVAAKRGLPVALAAMVVAVVGVMSGGGILMAESATATTSTSLNKNNKEAVQRHGKRLHERYFDKVDEKIQHRRQQDPHKSESSFLLSSFGDQEETGGEGIVNGGAGGRRVLMDDMGYGEPQDGAVTQSACEMAVTNSGGLMEEEICKCSPTGAEVADDGSSLFHEYHYDMMCVPLCDLCSFDSCGTYNYRESFSVTYDTATTALVADTVVTHTHTTCFTYSSGSNAGSKFCRSSNLNDGTCEFTMNDVQCTSCAPVFCNTDDNAPVVSRSSGTSTGIVADCTNIAGGGVYDYCGQDPMLVPDKNSPFVVLDDSYELSQCFVEATEPVVTPSPTPAKVVATPEPAPSPSESAGNRIFSEIGTATTTIASIVVSTVVGGWMLQ